MIFAQKNQENPRCGNQPAKPLERPKTLRKVSAGDKRWPWKEKGDAINILSASMFIHTAVGHRLLSVLHTYAYSTTEPLHDKTRLFMLHMLLLERKTLPTDGRTDRRTDGQTDRRTDGQTDGWKDGRSKRPMDGLRKGWTDGQTDRRTDWRKVLTVRMDV